MPANAPITVAPPGSTAGTKGATGASQTASTTSVDGYALTAEEATQAKQNTISNAADTYTNAMAWATPNPAIPKLNLGPLPFSNALQIAGAEEGHGTDYSGTLYNPAYITALSSLSSEISSISQYSGTGAMTPSMQAKLADLQTRQTNTNIAAWQSMANYGGSPGASSLENAVNSGLLTWQEIGQNIPVSAMSNDVQLAQTVDALVKQYNPAAPAMPTAVQSSASADLTSATNAITSDLTSQSALASYLTSNSANSLVQADATQRQNLAGIGSVGTAIAGSEGAANASRAVGSAAQTTTNQYATQRDILHTQNQNAVQSYINQVFSNDLTNNQALATMTASQKTQIQGQAAQSLVTQIQQSIGTADNASQAQLNQLQQAITAWQNAEAGSLQQNQLWSNIVSMGAGLLSKGAAVAALF